MYRLLFPLLLYRLLFLLLLFCLWACSPPPPARITPSAHVSLDSRLTLWLSQRPSLPSLQNPPIRLSFSPIHRPKHPTSSPQIQKPPPTSTFLLPSASSLFPSTPLSFPAWLAPLTHYQVIENVPIFRVLLDATPQTHQELQAQGIEVSAQSNGVFAAWMPLSAIDTLLHSSDPPRAIALSEPLKPHLNVSAPLIGVPQSRVTYGLDGRGVIIGVIDSGLDLRHPAFRRFDGSSRVLAVLDYSLPAVESKRPPRLFLKPEIDQALQNNTPLLHQDTSGHGTHVAGIAAGNGKSKEGDSPYVGMAPRADLVIVKALRDGQGEFDSGDLLESVAFVHQFAKLSRKPYVINLSLGGHQGPHDGSTLLERAMAAYAGSKLPGQILVASAGNEGDRSIYWGGWAHPEAPARIKLVIPGQQPLSAEKAPARVLLECWSDAQASLAFSIRAPNGQEIARIEANQGTETPIVSDVGTLAVSTRTDGTPPTRRLWALLLSNSPSSPLATGTWTIEAQGTAHPLHIWIAQTRLPESSAFFLDPPTTGYTIAMPGSAASVITVGSYNARTAWQNAEGQLAQESIPTGTLSSFSSQGPTPDGRPKPDLSAPGMYIASTTSSTQTPPLRAQLDTPAYHISQGTSQAAPHVAGAIALLLQQSPQLDLEQVRNLLIRSARADTTTTQQLYHPLWGFGKIDLLRALQTLQKQSATAPDPNTSSFGVLHPQLPADGRSETTIFLIPKDRDGVAITRDDLLIRVESTHGEVLGPPRGASEGIYQLRLRAPHTPAQATLRAWINGNLLETQPTLLFRPYPNGPWLSGCQPFSSSPLSLWPFFCLFFLLFLRKKKHRT
ncbi:S8 family serine peptidase [Myxococcota bacterium]|nr:S8 family serine peptidase [Myxococcota bacterium]